MLGYGIHRFAKIQQTFFAKLNDQFFSGSCFKRPGRSGTSSGETIYALSNGLCPPGSIFSDGIFYYRMRYSA
ncbi:hypothetical protein BH006_00160 [Salmonella enterica]|uniref:Uncharacterized protein n=1 Tax=Salmonella enterica TaxID=28901 RepID=A0A3F3IUP7_SALER|nr:hypothetical protein BH006_00160 [Salmonella enterica]